MHTRGVADGKVGGRAMEWRSIEQRHTNNGRGNGVKGYDRWKERNINKQCNAIGLAMAIHRRRYDMADTDVMSVRHTIVYRLSTKLDSTNGTMSWDENENENEDEDADENEDEMKRMNGCLSLIKHIRW
jgi:hypothetical protein